MDDKPNHAVANKVYLSLLHETAAKLEAAEGLVRELVDESGWMPVPDSINSGEVWMCPSCKKWYNLWADDDPDKWTHRKSCKLAALIARATETEGGG